LPIPNINKDSSNLYFPNKLLKLRNVQKRTLKPLNLSIKKKIIEEKDKDKEKETIQTKEIIEKPINKSFKANSFSKQKPIVSNIFPTQNFHTLNKSHLNSVFDKLDTKDDKNINNISKLENSILEMSINNKEEIGEVIQVENIKENNNNMDNIEDQKEENIELEEKENLNEGNEQLNMGEKLENDIEDVVGLEMENNNDGNQVDENENKEEEQQ